MICGLSFIVMSRGKGFIGEDAGVKCRTQQLADSMLRGSRCSPSGAPSARRRCNGLPRRGALRAMSGGSEILYETPREFRACVTAEITSRKIIARADDPRHRQRHRQRVFGRKFCTPPNVRPGFRATQNCETRKGAAIIRATRRRSTWIGPVHGGRSLDFPNESPRSAGWRATGFRPKHVRDAARYN